MTEATEIVTYVALRREGRRHELDAWRPGKEPIACAWCRDDPGNRIADCARSLLEYADATPFVSYEGGQLAELLSRPNVLPLARSALGQLRNLQELALVFLAAEPEYGLEALAEGGGRRARALDDAHTRDLGDEKKTPPQAGSLPAPPRMGELPAPPQQSETPVLCGELAATLVLYQRIVTAVQEAPRELLELLGPLLADDAVFAWLPWPEGAQDVLGLMRLGRLLPKRPAGRKREGSHEGQVGHLADVAQQALSPGGCIEDALEGYEYRPGQVDMAREVAKALQEEKFLLVEAGTGVGKSLAYLIPAVLWARSAGEPVVVSTNTKNLQQQLMEHDLPLLREALSVPFEAALLKGRGNYPCLRLVVSAAVDAASSLFRGERLAAAHLLSRLVATGRGDLEDISPEAMEALPELSRLVARVRSQGTACLGRACTHNDHCAVELARAYARRADIIVANHALTFADAKTTVLPRYSRLIFDEAHNIESAATEGLALECSSYSLAQFARTLHGEASSFTGAMRRKLEGLAAPGVVEALATLERVPEALREFDEAAGEFGSTLCDFCLLAGSDRQSEEGRSAVRLTEAVRETTEWQETAELGMEAHRVGMELFGVLAEFVVRLRELDKGAIPGGEGLDADAFAIKTRLEENLVALATVLQSGGEQMQYVTWAQTWRTSRGPGWSVHAAPVDVGPVLDEALYRHKAAIVFTSATLTVDGGFEYLRQRLGLNEHHERLAEMVAASPFDLTEQLLLCIPADMPDAAEPGFNEAVIEALRRICEVTEGGTLALFTARSRMQQAFARLEGELEAMGLTPLCQDITGPRWALLERLRHDDRAVLLGLKSFWEGVDVPGEALRCVVICKLPFAVPSDPIIEARQESAARQGLNPMHDYYIPEAVVGFKQGFGRLIRNTTDTGAVFVLDRRILTKAYGRRFFRSIQRCELVRDTLDECLAQAKGWLGR